MKAHEKQSPLPEAPPMHSDASSVPAAPPMAPPMAPPLGVPKPLVNARSSSVSSSSGQLSLQQAIRQEINQLLSTYNSDLSLVEKALENGSYRRYAPILKKIEHELMPELAAKERLQEIKTAIEIDFQEIETLIAEKEHEKAELLAISSLELPEATQNQWIIEIDSLISELKQDLFDFGYQSKMKALEERNAHQQARITNVYASIQQALMARDIAYSVNEFMKVKQYYQNALDAARLKIQRETAKNLKSSSTPGRRVASLSTTLTTGYLQFSSKESVYTPIELKKLTAACLTRSEKKEAKANQLVILTSLFEPAGHKLMSAVGLPALKQRIHSLNANYQLLETDSLQGVIEKILGYDIVKKVEDRKALLEAEFSSSSSSSSIASGPGSTSPSLPPSPPSFSLEAVEADRVAQARAMAEAAVLEQKVRLLQAQAEADKAAAARAEKERQVSGRDALAALRAKTGRTG